jgi:hypothetical protein
MRRATEVEKARYDALPLQGLIAVPEIQEPIRDIVAAAVSARTKRMPFLANRTIERIRDDCVETLRISHGRFSCKDQREQLRLIRSALEDTKQTLKAVSGLGLSEWRKDYFADYFDLYLEFARAIKQERIFLVTEGEVRDPEMLDILRRHQEAGVTTYALDRQRIGPELSQPIVLFDNALLLLHTTMPAQGRVDVSFTDDANQVREAVESFEALLSKARRRQKTVFWSPDDGPNPAPVGPTS